MPCRFLDVGDTAFTVEFGDGVDASLLAAVAALDDALARAMRDGQLPGVVEIVPTFRSLTVIYDPLRVTRAQIEPRVRALLGAGGELPPRVGRLWQLPVLYGAAAGPDLESFALACGLTPEAVIDQHLASIYDVYMLGFLPGFPFMGNVPAALAQPRRSEPRLRVPAGSVAVAGTLTAIYPWESPGGWHLLGRCPVPLFSPHWPGAALLAPGDRVRFRAVDADEFACLDVALAAARVSSTPPWSFLQDGEPR